MEQTTSFYRAYPSSVEADLELWGRFAPWNEAAPLLLQMHGWHGNVKTGHQDNLPPPPGAPCFYVQPEMRGRGDSSGYPDANGWELQDAVDALVAARAWKPDLISDEIGPHLHGGSGGGGNVLAMLGKFPDLFASAVAECCISDYAMWFEGDERGEFRDEMRDAGWIGGDPASNPEGYLSRGGRTTVRNLLTPLLIIHGDKDLRVPVEQSLVYIEAAEASGRGHLLDHLILPGVGGKGHMQGITPELENTRQTCIANHRGIYPVPPKLPERGYLVVAGFLITRQFQIHLEHIGQVAILNYDLAENEFSLRAPGCKIARLRSAPGTHEMRLACEPISLKAFCRELNLPAKV